MQTLYKALVTRADADDELKCVLYQVGDNRWLMHRGFQFIQFNPEFISNGIPTKYEEITNPNLVGILVTEHNYYLLNAITNLDLSDQIRVDLAEALIEVKES